MAGFYYDEADQLHRGELSPEQESVVLNIEGERRNLQYQQEQAAAQRRAQDFQMKEAGRLRAQAINDYDRGLRAQEDEKNRINSQMDQARQNNEAQRAMQQYAMEMQGREQQMREMQIQNMGNFQNSILQALMQSQQFDQQAQQQAQKQYESAQQFQQQFLTQEMQAVTNMESMIADIIKGESLNPLLPNQREASKQLLNLQQNPQGYLNDPAFMAMQEALTRQQAQQGILGGGLANSQNAQLFMQALPAYQQQLAAIASPNQGNIESANLLVRGLENTIGTMGSIGQQFAANMLPVNASGLTSPTSSMLKSMMPLLQQVGQASWGY